MVGVWVVSPKHRGSHEGGPGNRVKILHLRAQARLRKVAVDRYWDRWDTSV